MCLLRHSARCRALSDVSMIVSPDTTHHCLQEQANTLLGLAYMLRRGTGAPLGQDAQRDVEAAAVAVLQAWWPPRSAYKHQELANLAWAFSKVRPGGGGRGTDGAAAAAVAAAPAPLQSFVGCGKNGTAVETLLLVNAGTPA